MNESIIQRKSFGFALSITKLYQLMVEQKEYVLSKQLLRSGTGIGANVSEAVAAQSRADFISKMAIASKEARETRYWLQLLQESHLVSVDTQSALQNCDELIRILTSIVKTTNETKVTNPVSNSKLITQNSKL